MPALLGCLYSTCKRFSMYWKDTSSMGAFCRICSPIFGIYFVQDVKSIANCKQVWYDKYRYSKKVKSISEVPVRGCYRDYMRCTAYFGKHLHYHIGCHAGKQQKRHECFGRCRQYRFVFWQQQKPLIQRHVGKVYKNSCDCVFCGNHRAKHRKCFCKINKQAPCFKQGVLF